MLRSLWSGVAGLKTHQMEMDVIGNNIANVNTTAYKSQATGFQDILYQTVKQGTGAGQNVGSTNASQVGLGSKVASIYTNISAQGSAITTDNALDLMITGPSFFIVTPDAQTGTLNFSRDGSFTIDANGDLVTQGNGYYVMGTMGEGGIGNNPNLTALRVINRNYDMNGDGILESDYMNGEATSEAYLKGNIDQFDSALEEGRVLSLEVFGNDGEKYTVKFKFTNAGDEDDSTYQVTIDKILNKDGNTVSGEGYPTLTLKYDEHNGRIESITADKGSADGNFYKFEFEGDASVVGPLNVDFTNVTNYAGSSASHASTLNAYQGDTKGQNKGFANGILNGISFTDNGSVYGTYSNGQTVKKGQIAVAEFQNAMGLEKVGDNLYQASLNSGAAMVMDVTADGGYINSGVLEGSNVDLAKEFTDMITTQRGFQANSKVITTSDEMLQLLKGLKR